MAWEVGSDIGGEQRHRRWAAAWEVGSDIGGEQRYAGDIPHDFHGNGSIAYVLKHNIHTQEDAVAATSGSRNCTMKRRPLLLTLRNIGAHLW